MTVTVIRHSASLASLLSRSISSSSFDSFLPITDSMDEDWQEFGWLLDEEAIELPCLAGKLKEHEVAKRTVVTEQNATVRVPVDPSEISLNSSKESVSITPSVLEQRDVKVKSEADIVDLPSCSAAEGRGPVPKRTKFSVKIPDMLDEKPLISLASARNTCQPVLSGTELSSPGRRKRNSRKHAESSSEDESVTSIALSHSHNTRGRRKGVRHIAASETSASIKTDIKTETPPREIDPTQTHCICNKPYDPKKFYVGCDLCYRWFHGKCVSVSEKKSKKLNGWICEECSKEQKNSQQELYCVCRTPYDDSLFYVGCDGCEGWFHPSCVGITQAQAEKAAEYLCPSCAKSSQSGYESSASTASSLTPALNRADYPLLWRILEGLVAHRTSWPFREKVDTTKYPDYYSFIKKPMDLSTVQQKLENLEYQRLKDFSADITQIFVNARIYNPKDSAIYNCADILEKRFRDSLTNVKEEMDVRNRDQLRLSESRTVDSTLDIDTDQLLAMGDDVDPSVYNEILRTQR